MPDVFSLNGFYEFCGAVSAAVGTLYRPPVVLCIGSDLVTGDCLGPLTGQMLKRQNVNAFVYGCLSMPVTALNLSETLEFIRLKHTCSKVIAIDAAVGQAEEIGRVKVSPCGIFPGAAAGKKLPLSGDCSITATVSARPASDTLFFNPVRLGLIYGLSEFISGAVARCVNEKSVAYDKATVAAVTAQSR